MNSDRRSRSRMQSESPRSNRRLGDSTNDTEGARLLERDGQTVYAHNVDHEVAFISQPLDTRLGEDFIYDNTAGTCQPYTSLTLAPDWAKLM